jgi:hypothetical protein
MSGEVVARDTDSWVAVLGPVGELAAKIANTEFVPKALRGNIPATAACILTGREIGLGPMESLAKIHMVNGRPSLAAELMRSLVLRAGHSIKFTTLTDVKVTIEGKRAGEDEWLAVSWTTAMAVTAKVNSKDTYQQYPRAMLSSRATSELCRLIFPDALGGISYTPEELEEPAPGVTLTRAKAIDSPTTKVARAKTEKVEVEDPSFDDDEPASVDQELITDAQVRLVKTLFTKIGMKYRDAQHAYMKEIIEREITTSKELTKHEASQIIDRLQGMEPTPTQPVTRESLKESGANFGPGVGDVSSEKQMNKIGYLMSKLGMTESAQQLAYAGDVIEREIKSASELTMHEASRVITYLEKDVANQAVKESGAE